MINLPQPADKRRHFFPFLRKPSQLVLFHDFGMATISFPLAYVLRLGWDAWPSPPRSLVEGTVAFAVIAAVVLVGTEAHRGIWRYASVDDLLTVVRAVTLATMAFFPVLLLVDRAGEVPRSIP